MHPRPAPRASRVRALAARRPSQLLLVAILLSLFAAAWFAASRAALTAAHQATRSSSTRLASIPSRDDAREVWSIPAPELRAAPAPVPSPRPDATRWAALSLGVTDVSVAPVASLVAAAGRPAELDAPMSAHERRALLAGARNGEPDGLPAPQGYHPGIAVIVPGGANSDGICR